MRVLQVSLGSECVTCPAVPDHHAYYGDSAS